MVAPRLPAAQTAIRPHASIVHSKQYKRWRTDAIAFEFGDQTYTLPNRTLASCVLPCVSRPV